MCVLADLSSSAALSRCSSPQRCKCGGKFPTRGNLIGYKVLSGSQFGYPMRARVFAFVSVAVFIILLRCVPVELWVTGNLRIEVPDRLTRAVVRRVLWLLHFSAFGSY